MKNQFLKTLLGSGLTAALLTAFTLPAAAAAYQIDPAHSFIEFKTGHLGFNVSVRSTRSVPGP
jgi:polyisoprenoid-binding protein YceI